MVELECSVRSEGCCLEFEASTGNLEVSGLGAGSVFERLCGVGCTVNVEQYRQGIGEYGIAVRQGFSTVESSDEIQSDFNRLAAEWKRETAHLSSPTMIAEHRAYQEVVDMGPPAIPLILRDLQKAPAMWFMALREITGELPIREQEYGNIEAMRAVWIAWGERNGYI